YDGSEVGTTFLAQPKDLDLAVTSALEAAPQLQATPTWQRAKWLHDLTKSLEAQRDVIIRTMAQEAGKPLNDATTEFNRGIFTIEYAAEETKRIGGEVIPLDLMETSARRTGVMRRFPIGPVAG